MNSFLEFIEEDIDAKKTLFSTMPTNTKTEVKRFNTRNAEVTQKYNEYKSRVKKYIDTKCKSFEIKEVDKKVEKIKEKVHNLENIRFLLNPLNTYFEKMGFDNLLYEISKYYDFNFSSLNDIIDRFLDKFEVVGIKLDDHDFNYTCYVNEYMTSFLEVRKKKGKNYNEISDIFEKIYWVVPDIVQHIELNFRKLIKKHEWKFVNYIDELQKKVQLDNEINNYEDCLKKLKAAYIEFNLQNKEDINDIIELAKKKVIDINSYFADNKTRISIYNTLMIDPENVSDKIYMGKYYDTLEKLKINIEEYINYAKFLPLINNFKTEFGKQISTDEKSTKNIGAKLKNIKSQITAKEKKLSMLNWKIMKENPLTAILRKGKDLKQLKIESIKQTKELYELYKNYDLEYFKDKVLSILKPSMTISELLHLYYSFDYFKKVAIKKVYDISSYDEIIKLSDSFDIFSMNPTNIVINDIALFEETNISRIIMNRYRLENVNLTEENLDPGNLGLLLDKVELILRVNEIENSPTTVEKIWFMVQLENINALEKKNKT